MENTKKGKKEFDWEEFEEQAIKGLYEKRPLTGKDGILTPLKKRFLEKALQGETPGHVEGTRIDGNRKNGFSPKNIKTDSGSFEIANPRGREGSFQPAIVKKRQTILPEDMERGILSLYTHGSNYQDIVDFFKGKVRC